MLGIQYPVFQGGMAWIADGKLAAAVSNAGGLGIISAMNANAEYVREQIKIAKSLTDKLRLDRIRIYASAQNLLTITNYSGYDPEYSGYVDRGTYPASRTFTFGVKLSY